MKRAKIGGQTGMNGEKYKGGQFLPNTTLPKTQSINKVSSKKQEIAPFVWAVSPEDGSRSLYSKFHGVWAWDVKGVSIKVADVNRQYFGETFLQAAAEAAEKWNKGERW